MDTDSQVDSQVDSQDIDSQGFDRPPPLTMAEITVAGPNMTPVEEKTLQLQLDALNVLEGRVDVSTFSIERQKEIDNYYRFSPVVASGSAGRIAMMSSSRGGKG